MCWIFRIKSDKVFIFAKNLYCQHVFNIRVFEKLMKFGNANVEDCESEGFVGSRSIWDMFYGVATQTNVISDFYRITGLALKEIMQLY